MTKAVNSILFDPKVKFKFNLTNFFSEEAHMLIFVKETHMLILII